MGDSELKRYFEQLSGAYRNKDGGAMVQLLQAEVAGHPGGSALAAFVGGGVDLKRACQQCLEEELVDCAVAHLAVLGAMGAGNHIEAHASQQAAYLAFVRSLFQPAEDHWLVPALRQMTLDLRLLIHAADRQEAASRGSDGSGQPAAVSEVRLREGVEAFQKGFSGSFKHAGYSVGTSKKAGCIFCANTLFKVCFRLNHLRACKTNTASINDRRIFKYDVEEFPKALAVTYKFFMGRVHMFQDHDAEAEACLSYAFRYCPLGGPAAAGGAAAMGAAAGCSRGYKNRRMILQYLVPVKLLLGAQPHPLLLERYNLPELAALALAVRRGDLRSFNATMEAHQVAFVRQGLFLVLEKLKLLVYRNLFKRVCMIDIAKGSGGGSSGEGGGGEAGAAAGASDYPRMKLAHFERALAWLGADMDLDEIECILANLIGQGFIKAYLHHKSREMICKRGAIGEAFPNAAAAIAKAKR
jgi:hypothetical protein